MAFPYALDAIGWKTYMINGAWDVVQVVFVIIYWVETKGKSLEEIDEIFGAPPATVHVQDVMKGNDPGLTLEGTEVVTIGDGDTKVASAKHDAVP